MISFLIWLILYTAGVVALTVALTLEWLKVYRQMSLPPVKLKLYGKQAHGETRLHRKDPA